MAKCFDAAHYAACCLLLALLLSGCASHRMYVSGSAQPDLTPSADSLTYSLFAIGDLGHEPGAGAELMAQLREPLLAAGEASSLILLGDMTAPGGMPDKEEEEGRQATEAQLRAMLDPLRDYEGKIFAVPGERDLGPTQRVRSLQRLEKYLEDESKPKVELLTDDACSGPEDEDLTDDITLIGINTPWYLLDWDTDPEVNGECEYRDRNTFMLALADEINGLRDKTAIVALHHPLQANGNRGGHYSLGQHLFPLRDLHPSLYIPLPIVGTIARLLQGAGGSRQDLGSVQYKEMELEIDSRIENAENLILLSGHEHILQYTPTNDGNIHHIISGSGSVAGPAGGGDGADFAYGARGYSRIDFYENGSVYLSFFAVDKRTGQPERVFQRRIIENRLTPSEPDLPPVPAEPISRREVKAVIHQGEEPDAGGLYRLLLGDHYRKLYYDTLLVKVARLDTVYGGLRPMKRGGGMTTQSLHLIDDQDRRAQLRSVRKNPVQLLPSALQASFAADAVQDFFTSMHPMGAFLVPPLARPAGILSPEPILRYVPKQPGLGPYNVGFGDEIYMIEARPDGDRSDLDYYGNSKNIIGNDDLREEITTDWKIQADQRAYLRARLFDALIGDWDRHRDQWQWAEVENEDEFERYVPIGRDRDQAFSNYDGLIFSLAKMLVPEARKFQAYDYDFGNAKWLALNGKWNDRLFLTELKWEDWEVEVRALQAAVTDQVIDSAMRVLPEPIYEYSVNFFDINGKLKSRRDQLLDYARDFYEDLAKRVNVVGTEKNDYFRAERQEDGTLRVRLYDQSSEGEADEQFYERTFRPEETDEVVLYGLAGDDVFEMTGDGASRILVRVVGGVEKDTFTISGGRGPTRVYDAPAGMEVGERGTGARVKLSNVRTYNQYNFFEYLPSTGALYPLFGFNPDDGLFLGAGYNLQLQGWKKEPFASNHRLQGAVSVTTGAVQADYTGEFTDALAYRTDLVANASYRSPQFIINYFGLGNETSDDAEENDFNRVRQQRLSGSLLARFRLQGRAAFTLGPLFESVAIDSTAGRYIVSEDAQLPDRVFDRQHFGGVHFGFETNTLARPTIPDQGLVLRFAASRMWNLRETERQFTRVGGSLSYYTYFGKRIIGLATRIGGEHIDGEYEFYQAAQLGGRTNFRGARSERFLGNTSFYHNTDLRLTLFQFGKGFVPTVGGLLGGFDYGRVWLEGERSDVWHKAYGGGIWLAPFNTFIISATYFKSEDDQRIMVQAGFPF